MSVTLQVMDFSFNKLGEIGLFKSLSITRSYYGTGAVEITVDPRAPNALALLPECIVWPSGYPNKACIVTDVGTLTRTKLTVKGTALKGLAKRRVCVPPLDAGARPYQDFGWDRFTGTAEAAYLHYAQNNMIAPEDTARAFPGLVAAENRDRGAVLPWQARFDKLDAVFQSIGEATELGWTILPDLTAKQFVFSAWEGTDRTVGNALCLIGERNGNVSDANYKKTASGSASTVYVGGAGEDEERFILSVGGEAAGTERRELWAEAGSIDDADLLKLYGQTKLDAAAIQTTLSVDLIDSGACRYERDYDVGDQVLVRSTAGSMAARLVEMTEVYENGTRTLRGAFGSAPITPAAVVARRQNAAR